MNTQTPAVIDDALMERMWKFAERVAPAKFIPQHLRGDVASIFYALATGQDLGISWTHAMRSTFPAKDGGLGTKGDIMLALLLRNGFDVNFEFTENPIGCTCTITRPGGKPVSRTFTMEDAAHIQTRWIPTEEGGRWEVLAENYFYHNYPGPSCQWRSLAHCGRVAASDLMAGLYLPEELLYSGEKSASEPAPTGPSIAAVADEFVVAEKEDAPAVEVASNEVEKEEALPVTLQEQRGEPVPEESEKPAISQASDETATAAVETAYEIWVWTAKGFVRHDVPDQDRADTAEVMAQALANQAGQQTKVVARQGDTRQDVLVCEPPAKKAPEPPKPVTTFEVWGIMPDQKASQVQGESHATPDAATQRAIALAEERKFTTLVVRVEGDSRKEISRHRPPNGAPAEDKPQDFDSMIAATREKVGGDVKVVDRLITRYLAGFMDLGVRSLPKDKAKLAPPLVKLMEVIDSKIGDLKADPEALGAMLSGRTKSQLEQAFDKLSWPEHVRVLARKAMAAVPVSEDNFQLWLYHPMAGDSDKGTGVSLSSMEPRALEIFFPLMTLVKGAAWQVIDWAIDRKFGVTAALDAIERAAEKPVAQWDEALAKDALAELSKFSAPKPEPKLPVAQDPPADQDDLFNAGLPFEN